MNDVKELERAHALFEEARGKFDSGDLDAAADLFAESASINPHFKTLELLGECNIRRGRHQEAIIPLAAASTLNDQVRAPSLLAETLLHLGERAKARRVAQLALSRDQNNRKAHEVLAQTEDLAELYDK